MEKISILKKKGELNISQPSFSGIFLLAVFTNKVTVPIWPTRLLFENGRLLTPDFG